MIRPKFTLPVRAPIVPEPVQRFQEIDADMERYYVKVYDDIPLVVKDYLLLSYLRLFHLAPAVYGIKANQTNNRFYILMEKMDGSIGAYKSHAFSWEFTNIVAKQSDEQRSLTVQKIIDTAKSAYSIGLIHGDLCLPNIVYQVNGDLLLDFKLIDFDYSTLYHQPLNRMNSSKNCLGEYPTSSASYEINQLFSQLAGQFKTHFDLDLNQADYDLPEEHLPLFAALEQSAEDRAKNITIFNSLLEDFKNNPLIPAVLTSYAARDVRPIGAGEMWGW